MSTSKSIKVICPHCGFSDSFFLEEGLHFVICDCEHGGCDTDFVIEIEFEVRHRTFKLVEEKLK